MSALASTLKSGPLTDYRVLDACALVVSGTSGTGREITKHCPTADSTAER